MGVGAWDLELLWILELGTWSFGIGDVCEKQVEAADAASYPATAFSGVLAQLVRAPPCHGGGCGFEPRRLRGFCITKIIR
jgi:hypothetical protein